MGKIEQLLQSGSNVFTTQDLSVIWGISDKRNLLEVIKYYIRTEKLDRLAKGLYTLSSQYSSTNPVSEPELKYEIAQNLMHFSYISTNTALGLHGINFQKYSEIYSVGKARREYEINGQKYIFQQMKEEILLNSLGLIKKNNYTTASAERAVCDQLYFDSESVFDNLLSLNIERLRSISKIYETKIVEKQVDKIIKQIEDAKRKAA